MVKALLFVALLAPIVGYAMTADELRLLSEEAARKQRERDNRVKPDQVDKLLPAEKPEALPANSAPAPRSTKYSTPAPVRSAPPVETPSARGSPAPAADYSPAPIRRAPAGGTLIQTDAVIPNNKKPFGITIGSWFRGRLTRNISNADAGLVEIVVEEDVHGTRKTLPAGTLLFAEKQFNESTKRLELRVIKGITPNNFEFGSDGRAFAFVYDTQRVSGLFAIISADSNVIASRGIEKGLVAGARAAVGQAGAGNPVLSQAARGASDSVFQDATRAQDRSALPPVTAYVAPQSLLIRVEETF